ncbi:MAG: NADH-quinone oxidoreductase subunit N [Isosphaeraceae bacterium]|nr:NADH-quinone oxidoreductase subunit N [Isosphaeraceae bacterium]
MDSNAALQVAQDTLWVLSPELLLLLTAVVMMTAGVFVRQPRQVWSLVSAVALGFALVALLLVRGTTTDAYTAVALNDDFSFYSRLVLLLSGYLLLGLAHDQVDAERAPEFFGSLLMIMAGSLMVAAANELVFLFVGLELISIPTYLLLYLPVRNTTTQEAATKYFFLSIFSSGLLLYGLAFLYGTTGVSNLKALAYLAGPGHLPNLPQPQFGMIALVFVLAGLGFRVAAVPFHFYAPDVYEGSPTVMAALLSWIPKAVGFLAIIRTLTAVISSGGDSNLLVGKAVILCWIIAAVTMTLGNAVALLQDNLKRLFAYSSIAHAGYLMVGVTVAFYNGPDAKGAFLGTQGILFYLVAYALMTLGAFGIFIALSTPERPVQTVEDLTGLGRSHPVTALCLAVCLFSLAGIPPLAGFWGKFQIFYSAFGAASGSDARTFQLLAVIGVLNSAAGAYYYLRIVVNMYLRPLPSAIPPLQPRPAGPTQLAIACCVILTLVLGFFPNTVSAPSRTAAKAAVALPPPSAPPVQQAAAR